MARDAYAGYTAPPKLKRTTNEELIVAPVSISHPRTSIGAKINQSKKMTVVSHRELVSINIPSHTYYGPSVDAQINPGLATLFPWLSTLAAQYSEYRFRSLQFEYVPICSTATAGQVMIVPIYDPAAPVLGSEQNAIDHAGTAVDSVWKSVVCNFKVADMHTTGTRKFVRTTVTAGDLKTYDVGRVTVATSSCAGDGTPVGKLYVRYTVELHNPVLEPVSARPYSVVFQSLSTPQAIVKNTLTTVQYDTSAANSAVIPFTSPGAGVYVLPLGIYLVTYNITLIDNTNEAIYLESQVTMNNVPVTTKMRGWTSGVSSPNYMSQSGQALVSGDGVTAMRIAVTANGAAGAMYVDSYMSFQLVSL